VNPAIAKVVSEVLGGTGGVYKLDVHGNACALGGAYKALWALERQEGEPFHDFIGKKWSEERAIWKHNDGYHPGIFETYGKIIPAFEKMEQELLKRGGKVY